MICHDQEPLNYTLYQSPDLWDYDSSVPSKRRMFEMYTEQDWAEFKQLFGHINLRMAINPWLNVFDKTILLHSELNSQQVEKYRSCDFEPAYWFSHASIARDWFRYAQYDPGFTKSKNAKDFLIYNRAWSGTREYRLKFVELLIESDLVDDCLTSFAPWCDDTHYSTHKFVHPSLAISNKNLQSHFPTNTHDSTASADYVLHDYNSTNIEIVLETLFDDSRWQLTEKIFRPIACGQPFILASTPGSLKYLRSYGFKTFSPWINEAYDDITDCEQRLIALITEMKRISQLNLTDKQILLEHCIQISQHNKTVFFSDSFLSLILTELHQNIQLAVEQVQKTAHGKYFKKFLGFRKPKRTSELFTNLMPEVLNWLNNRNH